MKKAHRIHSEILNGIKALVENNIKMYVSDLRHEVVDWIFLDEDRDLWT